MANISFDDEMGRIQRALAQSHDLVVRRTTIMETLNLRTGEKVLELGCGGGSYAFEAVQFVGPTGRISAIDISADQIAAARERCAGFAWVQCQTGNLLELPYQDGGFDAATRQRCSPDAYRSAAHPQCGSPLMPGQPPALACPLTRVTQTEPPAEPRHRNFDSTSSSRPSSR
jgi:SAM-dependent methyltransferase